MSWIDAVGHAGYLLLFAGVVLIGRKWATGWLIYVVGDLVWMGLGVELELTSIVVWQAAFLVMALWNWRAWRLESKPNLWTQWIAPRESSGSSTTPASAASGT